MQPTNMSFQIQFCTIFGSKPSQNAPKTMAKRTKPSLGALLGVGLQFLLFFPDFDLHFGSPEAPFWLNFSTVFWYFFESKMGSQKNMVFELPILSFGDLPRAPKINQK